MNALFNRNNNSQVIPDDSFMTCILKVNTDVSGWETTVRKVLASMNGVNSFKMGGRGRVLISGKVTPTLLLKVLGKAGSKAEVIWWQFGDCSSNLFLPSQFENMYGLYSHGHGYDGGHYNEYVYGNIRGYDGGYYDIYNENNFHGRYGGRIVLNECLRPTYNAECGRKKEVINQRSNEEEPLKCCTIM